MLAEPLLVVARVAAAQWKDVLGILKIQGTSLDERYLDEWAIVLDVVELLARARRANAVSRSSP